MFAVSDRQQINEWFLHRDLPLVLTRRVRSRDLIERSAPMVSAFFLALGIIAVPDDVAVLWSAEQTCVIGQPPCTGTWFGIHIPIPQTIVHMSLFVAVLSGLYFTVSTSVDPLYRQRFFDPLIADVAVSLAGRDAYLALERAHTRSLSTRRRQSNADDSVNDWRAGLAE
ncbi:MAG: hypothetical protein JWR13_2922 [Mycobacterium sp.]|jgi:hypothetical protein|nr:hypothetical protein [Mycobacterium sp.]MDT5313671.1 hypothetical protein [Mycobacterium sp.]